MENDRIETYSLGDVHNRERQELFEQQLSASHTEMKVRFTPGTPPGGFTSRIRRAWISDLALVDASCGPCEGARTHDMVRRSSADHLVILVNRGGSELVEQDGHAAELRNGDAVVWDTARPVRFQVTAPVAKRSIFIPRQALEEVGGPPDRDVETVLRADNPSMSLLTSYLDILSRTADKLTGAALLAARNATLDLVLALIHPGTPAESHGRDEALLASMLQEIDTRLSDPRLSPGLLASSHHVSLRTVHRLFESTGDTVAGTIRKHRLAQARQNLVTGADPISVIAQRWCFSDASHFSRAFRKQYGLAPGEFRENAAAPLG